MKRVFPILIILVFVLSACGLPGFDAAPTAISLPTAAPTEEVAVAEATEAVVAPGEDTAELGDEKVSDVDGMIQVFIPSGKFRMGGVDENAIDDEKPAHSVELSGYWLDKVEVTNAMYILCVNAGACEIPREIKSASRPKYFGNEEFNDFPVIYVTHEDAVNYCTWAGRRLPTEAEWEYAARGSGMDFRTFPWGDDVPSEALTNFDYKLRDTQRVGSYPNGASPFGILDMAGNVWEWTADYYKENYYAESPELNPMGPDNFGVNGKRVVIRGGSWADGFKELRVSNRGFLLSPDRTLDKTSERYKGEANEFVGFRCAQGQ